MNQIKLVLADLDGTVVQPDTQFASKAVITALREAEAQGVKFAAVTGRPYWQAKDLLKNIGFNDPCVFEGGGIIINPATEEVLWSKTVPVETTRQAVEILGWHASIIEYGLGIVGAEDIDLSAITEPALSIWASVPVEKADELVEKLKTLPGVAVHANAGPGGDFSRAGIQVTHVEADKEHAVRELLRLTSSDKEHTLAIGDGNNDLPLFRSANIKVAMGNASDALKAAADDIVPTVHEDGFAEMIRRYIGVRV
jgi:hydroxymethylpyrimidine pyrophosphatase-like HAD family hydrolase